MSISKLNAVQGFKVNLKATREYIGLSSASQKQEKVVIVSVTWESSDLVRTEYSGLRLVGN